MTGKWAKQWSCGFFIGSFAILTTVFLTTTEQKAWDVFYLAVSVTGLLCILSLSFRKNIAGNGLGITANIGEVITQGRHGATGLLLFPLFAMCMHLFGLYYWSKTSDKDGNMVPKSANITVWIVTVLFIIGGLALFPTVNTFLMSKGFAIVHNEGKALLGVSFFWINIIAFVLAVTAQTSMILRYSFNWWLWIASNTVWVVVNLMTHNYIFAAQTMIYQINAGIGLYEWYSTNNDV